MWDYERNTRSECLFAKLSDRLSGKGARDNGKLNQQIYFHYIWNSLQCIMGLCDTDPKKAKRAIGKFADYLRYNLENMIGSGLVPFDSEIAHIDTYLGLEKLSGMHEFEIEYRLNVRDFMLPPLTLQPVVENAVQYGGDGALIIIETFEHKGNIYIRVSNVSQQDGACGTGGMIDKRNKPINKKKSVGIENVRTRLKSQCNGSIKTEVTEQGMTVTIGIPKFIA